MGWEPQQVQEGFDRDGNPVPVAEAWRIVTTTESEWDDRQRDKMLALTRYREDMCPDCGYPKIFHDPRYRFAIDVDVCPVKAALDKFGRIQGEADEQVRKRYGDKMPPATPDPADGRRTLVRLVAPEKGRPPRRQRQR